MKFRIDHIFFDLDNTLWDFESNSRRVITDLYHEFNLADRCSTEVHDFIKEYERINHLLWDKLRKSEISKEQLRSSRFYNSMQSFGHDDFELGYRMEEEYVKRSPYQKTLLPGTTETLARLNKEYQLHIITNGFKEVQYTKLKNCGLTDYFRQIIISEEVGFSKPDQRIFLHSMKVSGADPGRSLMIGDDIETDVRGAENSGMRAILFERNGESNDRATYGIKINRLEQILDFIER